VTLREKAGYLLWAAVRWPTADRSCPACGSSRTVLMKRKAGVTGLFRCEECRLMFRVPKSTSADARTFYQKRYRQGFTTDCPDEVELARLKQTSFRGSEKDCSTYLEVMQAAGVRPGQVVLDFGASWGYGSWQLRQAGFRVYSYEISLPRARYAAERLGCQTLARPEDIPEEADCFFAAHVIEHLPNPRELWGAAARVLKPGGLAVIFTPNGDVSLERQPGSRVHQLWGQVHPVLLSAEALHMMAQNYGFAGQAHTAPFDLSRIALGLPGEATPGELLFLARKGAGA
jgi:2-polyprenyl-3-methyl-5-hydroxy-6-metoxy-1,4-benzoquinol methylase